MSEKLFSDEALKAALKPLPDLPKNQGGIGVTATSSGDVGIEGELDKQLWKGVFVDVQGSWMRRAGGKVAAWIGWRGK